MPRDISPERRASLEATSGEDQPLLFLTITHPDLAEPIRVVNDTGTVNGAPAEWVWGGNTYFAFPFSAELLTDNDQAPRGTLEIANVDRRIGETLRTISGPASIAMAELLQSDFDTTVNPRTEIGTAQPPWQVTVGVTLREVDVDAMSVRATIMSIDDSREPFPALRATQATFPGLYR